MGSLEERAVLELEDESLVRSNNPRAGIKRHSLSGDQDISLYAGTSDTTFQNVYTRSFYRVFKSIKVVIFSTKINILMVFCPLTIILDEASGNHVSPVHSLQASIHSFVFLFFLLILFSFSILIPFGFRAWFSFLVCWRSFHWLSVLVMPQSKFFSYLFIQLLIFVWVPYYMDISRQLGLLV